MAIGMKNVCNSDPEPEPDLCSFSTENPLRNAVIINEIAWMGTSENSSNEWIELNNISGSSKILNGWQLLGKKRQKSCPQLQYF